MMRFLLLPCALVVSGCLSSDFVVTIRADGSGLVEHRSEVSLSSMGQFNKALGRPVPRAGGLGALDDLRHLASMTVGKLGSGVRLVSMQARPRTGYVGQTAVYEFENINALRVDLIPPLPHGAFVGLAGIALDGVDTRLTFTLSPERNGSRVLTIRFPRHAFERSHDPRDAAAAPEETAFIKQLLKGTRAAVRIQPETPLLRTSSPYRENNGVLLLEIDVERAIFGKEAQATLADPASFDELLWALGDLPGVKLAAEHVVTMEFEVPSQTPATPTIQAPPDTEIYLAPLSRERGTIAVGQPINISNSPGYDNQPSFTPDGRAILFTSARGGSNGETDIHRYDVGTRQVSRVTQTAEREYSPAVMPDGKHISVVRVEADGTQRLWKFTLDGREPSLVLTDIKPVGYHAWIDATTLALFVLGQPATLQVASTASGKAETIVSGIGRSIQRMPDGGVSFVRREAADGAKPVFTLMKLVRKADGTFATSVLVQPPAPGSEPEVVWTPDGTMLVASGGTLYGWRQGDSAWKPIADLAALGLQSVSRLAVSPAGDRLALVIQK
jgi:hypothetical protein